MSISEAFEKSYTSFEVKVYLQDTNDRWVDFTDRVEVRGKNKLADISNISHSIETQAGGSNFQTLGITLKMDNTDGFWDDPSQWTSMITEDGNTASWNTSIKGTEIDLQNSGVKLEIEALDSNGVIQTGVLGHFVIKNVSTDINSGTSDLVLNSKSQILKNIDAGKVKNGRLWYQNKPTRYLVEQLLAEEDSFRNSSGEILDSFTIDSRFTLPTFSLDGSDNEQVVSFYGKPPQWDGSVWLDKNIIPRCMVWGNIGYGRRFYLGIGEELWEWDIDTDFWTERTNSLSGYIISLTIDTNVLRIATVASLDYAENTTANFYDYSSSSGMHSTGSTTCNPIHFSVRPGFYQDGYSESSFFSGGLSYLTPFSESLAFSFLSESAVTMFAGEPVIFPFVQYPQKIDGSSAGLSYMTREEFNSYPTPSRYLEFSLIKNANIEPDMYSIYDSFYDNDISSIDINITENTLSFDNADSSSYITVYCKIFGGGFTNEVYSSLKSKLGSGSTITSESAGTSFSDSVPLLVYVGVISINMSDIDIDLIFDITGSNNSVSTASINFAKSSPAGSYSSFYLLSSSGSMMQLAVFDADNAEFTTYATTGSTDALNLGISYGQFPSIVWNTTTNSHYSWRASKDNTVPGIRYRLEEDGTDISGYIYGVNENESGKSLYLQPTCMVSDPDDSYIYVAFMEWDDQGSNSVSSGISNSYIHRIDLDLSGQTAPDNISSNISPGVTSIPISDNSGYDSGDIIVIGAGTANEEFRTISSVGVSSLTITSATSLSHSSGDPIKVFGECLYNSSGLDSQKYTITNMEIVNSNLVVSAFQRDMVGKANAFKIGYFAIASPLSDSQNSDLFDTVLQESPNQFRSIIPSKDNSNEFYTQDAAGSLWKGNISSDTFTFLSSVVDNDPNISTPLYSVDFSDLNAVDGLERTKSPVFGVSAPNYPDYTSISTYFGKHYLWQYDQYLTDRVELADFSGMSVWDSLSMLAQFAQAVMGFDLDAKGNFFFVKKNTTTSNLKTYDVHDPEDQTKTISKERSLSEIYNYVSIDPYYTELSELTATYTNKPLDQDGKDRLVNSDDIYLDTKSLIGSNVKLVCIKEGNVNSSDESGKIKAPLFKWKTYATTIETRTEQYYDASDIGTTSGYTNNTIIYLWSLFRGGIAFPEYIEEAVNIGNFVEASEVDVNTGDVIQTEVRQIVDGSVSNNYIVLESAFSFDITEDSIITIYKSSTTEIGLGYDKSGWSNDESGVTIAVSGTTGKIVVNDAAQLNAHTVIEVQGTYYRIRSVKERDDGNYDINLYAYPSMNASSVSNGDIIKAYYSPYAVSEFDVLDTLQYVPTSEYVYQTIGDTQLSIKVQPSEWKQTHMYLGDILDISYEGLVLKKDDKSKQISVNATSKARFGKLQYPSVDNRFITRPRAKFFAHNIMKDYKFPHYSFNIDGAFDPSLRFIDTDGHLYRVRVSHPVLLPNSDYREGYIRNITHNVKSGITSLQVRDDSEY